LFRDAHECIKELLQNAHGGPAIDNLMHRKATAGFDSIIIFLLNTSRVARMPVFVASIAN
jgi:hypothetical protein